MTALGTAGAQHGGEIREGSTYHCVVKVDQHFPEDIYNGDPVPATQRVTCKKRGTTIGEIEHWKFGN